MKDKILHGDCLEKLKELEENSIDLICTDPPYGIGFMGKEWDTFKPDVIEKGVKNSGRKNSLLNPDRSKAFRKGASPALESARYDHSNTGAKKFREWFTDISVEMLRVLKPGGFALVCIGARQDSVSSIITAMTDANFKTDFTSLFWTYASGFPKAMNMSKAIDKRLGAKRERFENKHPTGKSDGGVFSGRYSDEAISDEAKNFTGSFGGFQPKPAIEVIVVAMKPLSEKSFLDQALKNGKGITWLEACGIPSEKRVNNPMGSPESSIGGFRATDPQFREKESRFCSNLLVSDLVLKENSKYFSLDAWADTLPFLHVSKPAKSEKDGNIGEEFEEIETTGGGGLGKDNPELAKVATAYGSRKSAKKNHHPTVKPLKLMSYLITLGSRGGGCRSGSIRWLGDHLSRGKRIGS